MLNPVFDRFVKKSPICVMARGMMERVLNPGQLDKWFEQTADEQYTRDLLFSTIFDIMSDVVSGARKSVHAAYQASKEDICVSVTSVYNKLNGIEVNTSAGLVRYAAREMEGIIDKLGGAKPPILPGLRVKLLDGNCIEASEHRIEELRSLAAGALPGKSLVVFDPSLRMPIDVFPCEDGHAQERSLLNDVLATVKASDVWIADRNFCTRNFLLGIKKRGAFSVIREHKKLPFSPLTKETFIGRIENGKVFEQAIVITDELGNEYKFRRIHVHLTKPTRDGDSDIYIITNLSKGAANAKVIAELYRGRWTIETAFQELALHLNSEINTLGYPPAALFGFCIALIAYMILSVVKAALASVHGVDTVEHKISGYYLADEISGTYRGMMIAIPQEDWTVFRQYSKAQLIKVLRQLSANVKLSAFLKHPRGPKKKAIKRKSDSSHPHVSTAKIIADRKP
jgi:IS4 transposase